MPGIGLPGTVLPEAELSGTVFPALGLEDGTRSEAPMNAGNVGSPVAGSRLALTAEGPTPADVAGPALAGPTAAPIGPAVEGGA